MTVRRTIVLVVLLIVATPFILLAGARAWERWLVGAEFARLTQLGETLSSANESDWPALVADHAVWVRAFDERGAVTFDSHTERAAQVASPLSRGVEALFRAAPPQLALDGSSLQRPPTEATTLEIDEGRAVAVRVPIATADGRTLVLDTVLRRGIRQLLLVRVELAKLIFLQSLIALVAAAVLGRALVRPLEALARGARSFPVRPIADEEVLSRDDELGDVARALNELVTSLDVKWKDSVALAGELTHELKNPLATIAAASERLAEAKELTAEKRAEWTRLIAEAVTRLQASTDALLHEVRVAARAREATRSTVHYATWLDDLVRGYRVDPRWAGWRFEVNVEANVGEVRLDPEGWGAALRNLLDNALVQPAPQQVVKVSARRRGSQVETEVVDFGPGVSEGNREKIFQRFFTQRPAGAPRGTGLGLAIVKAVAEAHSGALTLQPANPARGAAFLLTLPG